MEPYLSSSDKRYIDKRYEDVDESVDELFSKEVVISDSDDYELPELTSSMFADDPWQLEELHSLKAELNAVKSRLNDYNLLLWRAHTKDRNKAGEVIQYVRNNIQPEFLTQAWLKFYEIISSFQLVPERIKNGNDLAGFESVHLCEAPGGFVTALNHWLKINVPAVYWNWTATTLNPYYEGNSLSTMINDDKFIRHTMDRWCFGEDNTGNLMSLKNLDHLVSESGKGNAAMLVTADGSIDCIDMPDEQESAVVRLHYCEIVTMLHVLSPGGSFLLKIFTIFENQTVCLLYLLACIFDKVVIKKPATSKEGNSETYVVCLGFKGRTSIEPYIPLFREYYEKDLNRAIFKKEHIPKRFLETVVRCSQFFKEMQATVILNNIATFDHEESSNTARKYAKQIKRRVAERYVEECRLRKLSVAEEMVGNFVLKHSVGVPITVRPVFDTYNERCQKKKLDVYQHFVALLEQSDGIPIKLMTCDIIEYELNDPPRDLRLCEAKPYSTIRSSRFCSEYVTELQSTLEDILRKNNILVEFPLTKNVSAVEEEFRSDPETAEYKVVKFRYTDPYDSHETIVRMYSRLKDLRPMDSIYLIGYRLLTQLNVALLYLLACTFASIKIKVHDTIGCIIILRHYEENAVVSRHLHDIYEATCTAKLQGKMLLSVLPIPVLYDCNMFHTIVECNHWNIKSFIKNTVETAIQEIKHRSGDYRSDNSTTNSTRVEV